MTFALGKKSRSKLEGVHPDLVRVIERAIQITKVDFTVTEGLRTKARQAALVKAGASMTLNSRHLTGHAVDLAALVGGKIRWDWPLYYRIAGAVKQAAEEEQVPIDWGGDWVTFKDGCHFQLSKKAYP